MKPWGCQHLRSVFRHVFPTAAAHPSPRLRGGGGGRENMPPLHLPPVRGASVHFWRTPSGGPRLSELRHALAVSCVPAHVSGYAAPPLRSGILPGPLPAPSDRQSFALTRQAPSCVAVVVPAPLTGLLRRRLWFAPPLAWAGEVPASAGRASARQGVPSRSIAQQRTSSLRAKATRAGFFRVVPPLVSRRYTARAQGS